jgi:UrcA family protein
MSPCNRPCGGNVRSWSAIVVLCALVSAGDVARAESASMAVSLRDLQMSSPADRVEALRRIHSAALQLCNRFGNPSRVDDRETRADCIRQAVEAAQAQLRAPIAVAGRSASGR